MIDFGHSVKLGTVLPSDLERLRQWRNDKEIWKWCRQNDLIDKLSQDHWYEKQSKDDTCKMYTIVASDEEITNVLCGVCGLTSLDWMNKRAEFSVYVAPHYQGLGYGKEALITLFDHGFKNLGLHLIWGECFDGNPANNLFKKLGMFKEGFRREFYWKDGRYLGANLWSIKETEWIQAHG